jgi:hypothetical protein
MIAQRIAAERRKQMGEERELTLDEGKREQEAFNLAEQQKPVGQRRAMNLRPTTRPGFVAPEIVLAEATGVEKQAQEAKTQAEKDRLTRISSVIMNDRKVAEESRSIAPALNRLDSLIGEDKVRGGTLAEFKLNAMSLAKSLGFNVDEDQLASGQTARAIFGQSHHSAVHQHEGCNVRPRRCSVCQLESLARAEQQGECGDQSRL